MVGSATGKIHNRVSATIGRGCGRVRSCSQSGAHALPALRCRRGWGEMIRRFVHAVAVLLLVLGRTALVWAQSGQMQVEPHGSSSVLLEPLGAPGAVNSPLLFAAGD